MDEAWREFFVTGKVTDYLRCKNAESAQIQGREYPYPQEERPDGAEYCSDRYGLECNADWRV